MEVKHGLGYQNYEDMMVNHIFYIDKTDFISEWWEYVDKVTLITGPRRFGKTLNMSTQLQMHLPKLKKSSMRHHWLRMGSCQRELGSMALHFRGKCV